MSITFVDGVGSIEVSALRNFVGQASAALGIQPEQYALAAGADASVLTDNRARVPSSIYWPFARLAYEKRLIDLLPAHGLPVVNYDLAKGVDIERHPLALRADFSKLLLDTKPTKIGKFTVDFPIGVPASILTANASFLKYYSERGYSILTYKTVRSKPHEGNDFPQWLCIDNPAQFQVGPGGVLQDSPRFEGKLLSYPRDPAQATMANSFGVPSLDSEWWRRDLSEARQFIRPGHQLLVVSVMSSVENDIVAIQNDFANTAKLAVGCGADVIELNFSCPNTPERAGHIYHFPSDARSIVQAVREAIGDSTAIFTKIGYLGDANLREFLSATWDVIDGVVASNTILAPVDNAAYLPSQVQAFPGERRKEAGISGWSIKEAAHRLAIQLVHQRNEIAAREGKFLTIFGLGGVMTRDDFNERLATGVDAVEICTGTYFNPMLGFECRNAQGRVEILPDTAKLDEGFLLDRLSGAASLHSPGATSRARERSADVRAKPEKKSGRSEFIDPVEALNSIKRRYRETPPSQIIEERDQWMDGLYKAISAEKQ